MKYKNFIIILVMILFLSGCSIRIVEAPYNDSNLWGFKSSDSFTYLDDEFSKEVRLLSGTDDIFDMEYIKQAGIHLDRLKASDAYSISNPLFIYNPYGIMPGTLYVYMGKENKNQYIKYNINTPDYYNLDFTASFYIGSSLDHYIEGCIAGIMPGTINSISIQAMDETGSIINENRYNIYVNKSEGFENSKIEWNQNSKDMSELSIGLYCYYDTNEGIYNFYDNSGIKRAEIITKKLLDEDTKLIQADNFLFYADTKTTGIFYNRFGKMVNHISIKEGYEIASYDYDEANNRILILCQNNDDIILTSYNINTNEQQEIGSLNKTGHLKNIINRIAKSMLSISIKDDNDIILFVEDEGIIFNIDNIDSNQVISWMFSNHENLKSSPYNVILLKSFEKHDLGEMKAVRMYTDKRLIEGCRMLGITTTIKDEAYYIKMIVNEIKSTYNIIDTVKLELTNHSSKYTLYGNNIIILNDSGSFSEFNQNGYKLATYHTGLKDLGKVYKYNMSRYWF